MSFPSPLQMPQIGDDENRIILSSESHVALFYHDEEIINNFRNQIAVAHQHISSLEEKLRSCNQDCESARAMLYDSELARQNELQCRMAFQRHLQLEQHRYNECAGAYQSVREELGRVKSELETILTLNEMFRQEIEHHQDVIESMKESAQLTAKQGEPSWIPGKRSQPGSPSSHILVDEPSSLPPFKSETGSPDSSALAIVMESPPFSIAHGSQEGAGEIGQGTKQRKARNPRNPTKSKASSKATEH